MKVQILEGTWFIQSIFRKEAYEAEAQSELEEKEKENKIAKAGRNLGSEGLEGSGTVLFHSKALGIQWSIDDKKR